MKNNKIKKHTILIVLLLFLLFFLLLKSCKEAFASIQTFPPVLEKIKIRFNKELTKNYALNQLNQLKITDKSKKKNRCDLIKESSIKSIKVVISKFNKYFKHLNKDVEIIENLFQNKITDKINKHIENNQDNDCTKKNGEKYLFTLNKIPNSLFSLLISLEASKKIT